MTRSSGVHPAVLLIGIAAGGCVIPAALADLAACAAIGDPRQRLACFDHLAAEAAGSIEEETILGSSPSTMPAVERRREREARLLDNPFGLIAHLPNYILPLTYNSRKNVEPFRDSFPGVDMDDVEAKFQISFKAKLWDITDRLDLWAAYTQESWWQLYNEDASKPFRETDYQPELIAIYETDAELMGFELPRFTLSLTHQSNGRGDRLSRSWNRVIAGVLFDRGNFAIQPRIWYRLPEDKSEDDNPDTEDYYGYGDLRIAYSWRDMTVSALLRNNFQADNRGAVQLDLSFPLNRRFKAVVQYFHGYGESLIDYDVETNRIGLGIMLTDWL